MKPPKTAALWTQLERLGWRHDALPVATIMASHEDMEKELAELKAGFDAEGRTAAEACCEDFKRELFAKLKSERSLADRLAEALTESVTRLGVSAGSRQCLAAWKAARDEQKP